MQNGFKKIPFELAELINRAGAVAKKQVFGSKA